MGIDTWWDDHWISRSVIRTPTLGSPHSSGIHFVRLDADLDSLVAQEKLRSDYADLRIICQKNNHNINVPHYIVVNTTPKRIFFAAQHDIPANTNIGSADQVQRYYMYFENPTSYTDQQPDNYENINFPQAPYSVHASWYETPYGKYRDKHLFRLNDDPSAGPVVFTDAAGHGTGISRHHQKVQKGHSGILDQSVFFDGDYVNYATPSGTWIEVPQNAHNDWACPSGDWSVDFWLRIHPKGSYHYGTVLSHSIGHTVEYDEPYPRIWHYFSKGSNYAITYARCNFSSRMDLYNFVKTGNYVPSGTWNHFRIAYRTGADGLFSRIHIWCNGKDVDNYHHAKSTDSQAITEDTCYFSREQIASLYIGYNYRNETSDLYMLTGWLEQLRYSTFVYPAVSGTGIPGDAYNCAPDWVDQQYIANLSPASLQHSISGAIGGFVFSKAIGAVSGIVGAYALGRAGEQASIGGIFHSITDERSTHFGGFLWSNVRTSGTIGGFAICSRGDIEVHSIEGLCRTITKVYSELHEDQRFATDAGFAFYGNYQDHFDAKLGIQNTSTAEFDARARIYRIRKNPHVKIIDIQHTYSGFMPAMCSLTASGHAYDYNNVQLSSGIKYVSIIWGDSSFTLVPNAIESGSIWNATHIYSHSGIYKPIVFVRDKYGHVGGDCVELNLASGVTVPYISLSGSPRAGTTPPPLSVNLKVITSGILGSHTLYWDLGNGVSYFNNAVTQIAQYPMPGDYIPWVRIEDSRGIYVMDTLRIGYNR